MKLLDDITKATKAVHDYFGYVEDWVVIPLDDCTNYHWHLTGEGSGDEVLFSEQKEHLIDGGGNYYAYNVYTQRFLKKLIY